MTGKQLYRMYQRAAEFYNCVMDDGEDLGETDRDIWTKFALEVNL